MNSNNRTAIYNNDGIEHHSQWLIYLKCKAAITVRNDIEIDTIIYKDKLTTY